MNLCFGVDPGTHTGLALWDAQAQKFLYIKALHVHRAIELVWDMLKREPVPVIFEDARQRQWFGHSGREKLQGAGAAKRDAAIWEHFLEDIGTPYIARRPSAGSTKWSADQFKRVSGWTEATNEHGRDAGVLVCGLKVGDIASVIRSWNLTHASTAARSSSRR